MTDTENHIEVIRLLSAKLKAYYIFPDVAEKICVGLQKHLEDGDYHDITEDEFFAYALTTHMQEICHDEHLWVKWHLDPLPDEEALRLSEAWRATQQLQAEVDIFLAHLGDRFDEVEGDLIDPADMLATLRTWGLYDVGRTASGEPLDVAEKLLDGERRAQTAAEKAQPIT